MNAPIEIPGTRILIREWRDGELEGMHRWLSDPAVNHFLSWGTRTLKESEDHLREALRAQRVRAREKFYLAVELLGSPGITIGATGFSWIESGVAEIGYFLEPAYWGHGYATEAAQMTIGLAFDHGAKRILASCDAENGGSEAVMKRCGMTLRESKDSSRLVYCLEQ